MLHKLKARHSNLSSFTITLQQGLTFCFLFPLDPLSPPPPPLPASSLVQNLTPGWYFQTFHLDLTPLSIRSQLGHQNNDSESYILQDFKILQSLPSSSR